MKIWSGFHFGILKTAQAAWVTSLSHVLPKGSSLAFVLVFRAIFQVSDDFWASCPVCPLWKRSHLQNFGGQSDHFILHKTGFLSRLQNCETKEIKDINKFDRSAEKFLRVGVKGIFHKFAIGTFPKAKFELAGSVMCQKQTIEVVGLPLEGFTFFNLLDKVVFNNAHNFGQLKLSWTLWITFAKGLKHV